MYTCCERLMRRVQLTDDVVQWVCRACGRTDEEWGARLCAPPEDDDLKKPLPPPKRITSTCPTCGHPVSAMSAAAALEAIAAHQHAAHPDIGDYAVQTPARPS